MPPWPKTSFDAADAELHLSRFGFDVDFDAAYVHSGSLHIDGDLTIDGTLDLDAGVKESFGLVVTGALRAHILTVAPRTASGATWARQ